jgi:hypothetical protein
MNATDMFGYFYNYEKIKFPLNLKIRMLQRGRVVSSVVLIQDSSICVGPKQICPLFTKNDKS